MFRMFFSHSPVGLGTSEIIPRVWEPGDYQAQALVMADISTSWISHPNLLDEHWKNLQTPLGNLDVPIRWNDTMVSARVERFVGWWSDDFPPDDAEITSVDLWCNGKRTGPAGNQVQLGIWIGGTAYWYTLTAPKLSLNWGGATVYIGASCPATGNPWTIDDLKAVESIGYKSTTLADGSVLLDGLLMTIDFTIT